MRSLLIALQFLTCVPIRLAAAPGDADTGRSLLWYPAVGLLIGAALSVLAIALDAVGPSLAAALVLLLWVLVPGVLHLDGLADFADAWVGGRGDRARSLALMQDPHAGSAAVTAIVVVLLLKFAALSALLGEHAHGRLILAPLLARTAIPVLFVTTPYVRQGGLGSSLSAQAPRTAVVIVTACVCMLVLAGFRLPGLLGLAVAAGVLLVLRSACLRRLGGFTGDCAGAAIELVETATLLALSLASCLPLAPLGSADP